MAMANGIGIGHGQAKLKKITFSEQYSKQIDQEKFGIIT